MKMRPLATVGALAALAATSAAAASLDLSRQIDARGAKPAWSLKVTRGTDFSLTRPGKPALAAKAPGAAISSGAASWTAKTAEGQPVKVTLTTQACKLGASSYPMTAQVVVGAETLSGCAGYAP